MFVSAKRPTLNTDGSPVGNSTPQLEIVNASGTVIKSQGGPSGAAGDPYTIVIPLNASEAAAAVSARTWVNAAGGPSEKVEGAPTGGFQPSIPNPPSDVVFSN